MRAFLDYMLGSKRRTDSLARGRVVEEEKEQSIPSCHDNEVITILFAALNGFEL